MNVSNFAKYGDASERKHIYCFVILKEADLLKYKKPVQRTKRGIMHKVKKVSSKNKSQFESLQIIPMALKERHDIIMNSNQLIVFDSWTSCATRIPYELNGVSAIFEEYRNDIFETINDSIEPNQFWRYFVILDKKTLSAESLKALLMNDWLTLDSYGLVAYVENFHNDYLKVCLSYEDELLKPRQKDKLLNKFFQAVNNIELENN